MTSKTTSLALAAALAMAVAFGVQRQAALSLETRREANTEALLAKSIANSDEAVRMLDVKQRQVDESLAQFDALERVHLRLQDDFRQMSDICKQYESMNAKGPR